MTRECVRLAVLGDPLDYTRSPILHRAGLAALGVACESSAMRTPPDLLGVRLEELAAAGYRGVNLTAPLKAVALEHLGRVSETARRAQSVNTVGFDDAGGWGDTTDGPGFVDLLSWLSREVERERPVFLGAGGAARSLALSMVDAGGSGIVAWARRPGAARAEWEGIPRSSLVEWGTLEAVAALRDATLVIQATPLAEPPDPELVNRIPAAAVMIDLRYGPEPTPWVRTARAAGRQAWDGLGLLVFQARRSLSLWTAREVPLDPLAHAVGWPR